MPISRPLLLTLIGAVLVGAAFFATRGGSSDDSSSAPVAPAPEPQGVVPDTKAKAPVAMSAREALKGTPAVTSGTFDLHITAKRLDLTASGSFQSQGLAKMPLLDIAVTGKSAGRSIGVGAVSTGKTAYLERGNQALVLQPEGWAALTRARAQAAQGGPSKQAFNGYSKKELRSFEFQGQERIDGAPALHFRGAVDPSDAREEFRGITSLFEKTSLDSPLPGVLARSIKGGTIDFWVGADTHIVRRELYRYESAAGPVQIDYKRSAINQPQTISAPANAIRKTPVQAGWDRESFGLAFSALTVGVLVVEPAASDAEKPARTDRPAKPNREPARKEPARRPQPKSRHNGTTPAEVKRAVDRNRIVVLFFRQRGADDDAVASSINSIRGRRGVTVFTLPVGQAPKYGRVGGASVVRAPTVVLIGHDGEPLVFEGFIDAATLAQAVTDAR